MEVAKARPDYFLLAIVGILIILGVIIIASVSASILPENPTFYLFRHLKHGLLPGLLLGFAVFKTPLYFLKKWSVVLLLLSLFLMVLVFFPGIGLTLGGASRWINLGIVTFQPSEFLKLTFILYLAAWLAARSAKRENKKKEFALKEFGQWSATTLIAFLAVMGIIVLLLIFQPDASTLFLIAACALLMYFSAGTPIKHTLLIIILGLGGLVVLIQTAPYRFERMLAFLNPEMDPMGLGYQINQAIMTVGSGGIFGMGLGMGIQRFLPQPLTDSIFAIFAEQAGFVGSIIIVVLFTLFFWRGCVIAKNNKDDFCKLAALGISFWITLQAFIHIGVALGVLPVTGIPIPFVSYGGTATATSLIGVGILVNIYKNARKI
jgi:cell division protein FtsW